jgi:aminopeptidase N
MGHFLHSRLTAVIVASLLAGALASGCGGILASHRTSTTLGAPNARQPATTQATGQSTSTSTTQPSTTADAGFGSPGAGDPYFPSAGNGGYDVQSYDISLDIDPAGGKIAGTDVVTATALEDLAGFNLDLMGLDVSQVQVNGKTASYGRSGQELQVTCPEPVAKGARFSATVTYSGVPTALSHKPYEMGWQHIGGSILTLDEPQGAATWFPANDTPADKATYTFHLTVPQAYTAAANGVLTGTETKGASRTFIWTMDKPMATYLAAVDVGTFSTETSTSPAGVPIRNYFATDVATVAHDVFSQLGAMIDYFAGLFGPYPFAAYGVVAPDGNTGGAAMENQTLSLYGRDVVDDIGGPKADPTRRAIFVSHELAHQWFGDSVTLAQWDDIWLNEGFATYCSWLWLEHDQGEQALQTQVAYSQQVLAKSTEPPPGEPGVDNLFGASVYLRGGLTLHALRLTVGDDSFFRTLRTWADRHKYGSVTTEEFIALAKEEAPQVPAAQIDALFQAWLYQAPLPALPQAGSTVAAAHAPRVAG